MYPWYKKVLICSIISFYANLGLFVVIVSFCCSSMQMSLFWWQEWKMIAFYKSLPSTWLWSAGVVLIIQLTIFFHLKHTTTSYFKECFSNSFLSHPYKKNTGISCSEKQKGNSKLREIASNRPLSATRGFFWCNMSVFPISYEHLTHVGMLQSRSKQCEAKWLLLTWSDYARYFARSLFVISTTFQIKLTITD